MHVRVSRRVRPCAECAPKICDRRWTPTPRSATWTEMPSKAARQEFQYLIITCSYARACVIHGTHAWPSALWTGGCASSAHSAQVWPH
eukprot:10107388-Lingulodinium_polyedra.AAC.1